MSLRVVYLPEARDDIDAAYAYYEQQLAGLGERFLESLRDRINRIRANPALYGVLQQDIRAAPLRQFPYVIYYRVDSVQMLIIAVVHGRRSSRAWRGRV